MKSNKFAFSLIELSIVLIIIGLLVAGVTGGQSLIRSAQMTGFINEVRGYRQALMGFLVAKGRLPGDLNNDGCMGWVQNGCTEEVYTASSFPSPYNVADIGTKAVGTFIDLYLEGLIDFKPDPNYLSSSSINRSVPGSKVYKKVEYINFFTFKNPGGNSTYFRDVAPGSVFLEAGAFNYQFPGSKSMEAVREIDKKIDNGEPYSGKVRALCYSETYDAATYCQNLYYELYNF